MASVVEGVMFSLTLQFKQVVKRKSPRQHEENVFILCAVEITTISITTAFPPLVTIISPLVSNYFVTRLSLNPSASLSF